MTVLDWSTWIAAPNDDADVPWFFTTEPTPTEGVVWCCAFFAATAALAQRVGLSPDNAGQLVIRSAEALTYVHADASARDGVDYIVAAAAAVVAELLAS